MAKASAQRKEAAEEFWQWARENPRDYGNQFCKVVNKQKRKVPFILNVQQEKIQAYFDECDREWKPKRIAIDKYRQPGITKYMGLDTHRNVVSRENNVSLITAQRKNVAERNLRLQKEHIKNLPDALRPHLGVENKGELYLEDRNSSVYCNSANDPASVRGDTVNDWKMTEAAYYGEQGASLNEVYDAGAQQVPDEAGTCIAVETTANGTADEFYDFWNASVAGENGFDYMFLHWGDDPECQKPFHGDRRLWEECKWYDHPEALSWEHAKAIRARCAECNKAANEFLSTWVKPGTKLRERMLRYKYDAAQMHWYWDRLNRGLRGDQLKMCQEYPSCWEESFIASGTPMFDGEQCEAVKKHCVKGTIYDIPIFQGSWDDLVENDLLIRNKTPYFEVWEKYQPGSMYVWFADSSLGNAKSNPSAAYCFKIDTMEIVAAIHGKIDPDLYGEQLSYVGYLYGIAIVAPEVENTGHTVLAALNRINYPNIYQRYRLTHEGWTETEQLGWSTNTQTKQWMVGVARKLFNMNGDNPRAIARQIKDEHLVHELSRFTHGNLTKRTMGAKSGSNDDRCIAMMGGLMVCHQEQGLDLGESLTLTKDAREAQAFIKEHEARIAQRAKTNNVSFKEHIAIRKLFLKGMDVEEIEKERESMALTQHYDEEDDY